MSHQTPISPLTKRETQVAELLAWGALKKEVAAKFGISVRTVENTARNIYEKIGVRSVNQLSAWWFTTKYHLHEAVNPMLAVLFIFLCAVNEYRDDNDLMRAPRNCKVSRAAKRSKRENS